MELIEQLRQAAVTTLRWDGVARNFIVREMENTTTPVAFQSHVKTRLSFIMKTSRAEQRSPSVHEMK